VNVTGTPLSGPGPGGVIWMTSGASTAPGAPVWPSPLNGPTPLGACEVSLKLAVCAPP